MRRLQEAAVAVLHRCPPRRVRLDGVLGRRPSGGVGDRRLQPDRHPARGTPRRAPPPPVPPTRSTGSPVASAMACIHGATRVPPPVATMRDAGAPLISMSCRTTNPDASYAARRTDARVVGEVQPVERAATIRIVEGRAFTADVRRPHRHPPGSTSPDQPCADKPVHPAEEQTARVARPADLALARRGMGNRPQAGHLAELADCHPHDQRRTAQHEYVAVLIGACDDLLAGRRQRRRPARRRCRAPGPTAAPVGCTRGMRSAVRRSPRIRRAPAGAVEQRMRGGGGEVDDRLAASAWLATAVAGQYPRASGASPPSSAGTRRPRRSGSWYRDRAPPGPGRRRTAGPASAERRRRRRRSGTAPSPTRPPRGRRHGPAGRGRPPGRCRHASSASCSSWSGQAPAAGAESACATTRPSSSAATALTAVVPMSMPIVTSLRDTRVTVRQHGQS